MDAVEARQLVSILVTTHELLSDVAIKPSAAIPVGLWEPIAAALLQLGEPSAVVELDSTGRIVTGPDGYPIVKPPATPPGEAESAYVSSLRHFIVTIRQVPPDAEFDRSLADHGLTGRQLAAKKALVDYGYADYVGGGRLPEVATNDSRWLRRQARRLQRALAPCATTLDSLSNVPGLGVLGLVSEAVSATEQALNFRRA